MKALKPLNTDAIKSALISVFAILAFALLCLKSCDVAMGRQAYADYEQCLSWQKDGYPVQCNPSKYGIGETLSLIHI